MTEFVDSRLRAPGVPGVERAFAGRGRNEVPRGGVRFPMRLALQRVLLVAGQVSALAGIPTVEARASLGDRQHHRIAFSTDTDS